MKNIFVIFILIYLFSFCNNKTKTNLSYKQNRIEKLDSIAENLKYTDIINKTLIEVIKKLEIKFKNKNTYFNFYDEPNYDTLNLNDKFAFFLFVNQNHDYTIQVGFDICYSEIPFYILRTNNDSMLLKKLENKKVKSLFIKTKNINLTYILEGNNLN